MHPALKLTLGRIYLAIAGLWFTTTFLILLPLFFIADKGKSTRLFVFTSQIWCFLFFPPLCLRINIKGKLPANQPYIIVANHTSYLDIPVLTKVLNIPHAFVGKSSLGKIPLFGYMYRAFHILVDRKSKGDRAQVYTKTNEALKNGKSVIIFPEGRVEAEGQPKLSPFYDGAFVISKNSGFPILPIVIKNNYRILPDDKSFIARMEHPEVEILPLVFPESFADHESLKDHIYGTIAKSFLGYSQKITN